jgi:hypothetical protein
MGIEPLVTEDALDAVLRAAEALVFKHSPT